MSLSGNPPYLNVDDVWGRNDYRLRYLKAHYADIYIDKTDILFYFLHRAVSLSKGFVGFIVSRAFLEAFKAGKLRGWLAGQTKNIEIVDFQNQQVFENVGITSCITFLSKVGKSGDMAFYRALTLDHPEVPLEPLIHDASRYERLAVPHAKIGPAPWLFGGQSDEIIIAKIDGKNPKLGDVFTLGQGMQTGLNDVFGGLPPEIIGEWEIPKGMWRWRARNSDIHKWTVRQSDEVLLYLEDVSAFSQLPTKVKAYLTKHRAKLEKRAAFIRGDCEWWRYTWPLHRELYGSRKVLCPYLASGNRFALDEAGRLLGLTDTTVIFDGDQPEDIRYFLGILNSRVLAWRFTFIGKLKSGGIREYFWNSISKMPLPRLDLSVPAEKKQHDQMVDRVRKIIELGKERNTASEQQAISIDRAIERLEDQLENAVADLFGLTIEERDYVERALRKELSPPTAA
jgi:Eco57I restriction-modification methylase/TaqI-like C-terminal specificity domain